MMCCHLLRANHHVTQSLWDLLDGNLQELQGRKGGFGNGPEFRIETSRDMNTNSWRVILRVRRIQWASWLDVKSP